MTINDLFQNVYGTSIKELRRSMKERLAHVIDQPGTAIAVLRYRKPVAVLVSPRFLQGMATEMERMVTEIDELYDKIKTLENGSPESDTEVNEPAAEEAQA